MVKIRIPEGPIQGWAEFSAPSLSLSLCGSRPPLSDPGADCAPKASPACVRDVGGPGLRTNLPETLLPGEVQWKWELEMNVEFVWCTFTLK